MALGGSANAHDIGDVAKEGDKLGVADTTATNVDEVEDEMGDVEGDVEECLWVGIWD